jgi:16S rRNA (adenine1518-N6/adenine1519-N6)-dimethyltransferase
VSEPGKPFAKRSFGQNFLVDANYVRKIVDALQIIDHEQVIEIGPGRGALSEAILDRGASLTAIELDRDMAAVLECKFKDNKDFHLVQADALTVDLDELIVVPPAKLSANLPYYISTPILRRLIEHRRLFSRCVLMFQREVAERIAAPAGSKERGYLSVLVEGTMNVERLFDVPPTAFRPRPKVWSSVVRLTPKQAHEWDFAAFERLVSAAFAQRRMTIFNNFKTAFPAGLDAISEAGIDPKDRAEVLTLDQWLRLLSSVHSRAM